MSIIAKTLSILAAGATAVAAGSVALSGSTGSTPGATPLAAQTSTARLYGTVTNNNGEPVVGIPVTLVKFEFKRANRGGLSGEVGGTDALPLAALAAKTYKAKTNDKGEYEFAKLPTDSRYQYEVGKENSRMGYSAGMLFLRSGTEELKRDIKLPTNMTGPGGDDDEEEKKDDDSGSDSDRNRDRTRR